MPTAGEQRVPGLQFKSQSKNATPALGAIEPLPVPIMARVPPTPGPIAVRARGSLWMANAMPSAPLPPSLAVNTTLNDRVKSILVLLHAVPPCKAAAGFSCSVEEVGDVAAPFFVHSEKSCGRVEAEAVGVLVADK